MVMNIHIHTQYRENYGSAEQPYWKFKGGDTIVVTGFTHPLTAGIGQAAATVVAQLRSTIEYANPMSEEYILDWELLPEGTLTQWEKDQLEFDDGKIDSPSKRVAIPADLVETKA